MLSFLEYNRRFKMSELLTKDSIFRDFPDVVNIKQFQEMMGVSKKTALLY